MILNPLILGIRLIDSTRLALTLERSGETRKIKLISDFVELNMGGEFSLKHAIDLLGYQSTAISQIIKDKFKEFNPLDEQDSVVQTAAVFDIPDIIDSSIIINYDFEFDDFKIIAVILGEDKLDISGSGSGQIKSTPENFSISTDIKLDYLVKRKKGDVVYLSEFELGLNFSRDNRSASFENLFGTVSATGNRLYIRK